MTSVNVCTDIQTFRQNRTFMNISLCNYTIVNVVEPNRNCQVFIYMTISLPLYGSTLQCYHYVSQPNNTDQGFSYLVLKNLLPCFFPTTAYLCLTYRFLPRSGVTFQLLIYRTRLIQVINCGEARGQGVLEDRIKIN